jgi:hypothetical protein
MAYSFLKLAERSAARIPGKAPVRTGDLVTDAKAAILFMLEKQRGYVDDKEDGRELPKTKSGDRTVATWFTKTPSGYWTNIRWGQRSLALENETCWFFSTAEKLKDFYDSVETGIKAGELNEVIEAAASTAT